jgi:acyl-CoA thioester hydrolase
MAELLKGFPVTVEQALSWGDMDMHGHINNIWFFRYIENARIAYYETIGKYEHEKETGTGFILASTTCKFKSSLSYPDVVATGARIEKILQDRAIMSYRVISRTHNRIAAEAEATLVSFDHSKNRKHSFPEVLRQRINEIEIDSVDEGDEK